MGVSRDTFYRYQELVEEGGLPKKQTALTDLFKACLKRCL